MELEYVIRRNDLKRARYTISNEMWRRRENKDSKVRFQLLGFALWIPVGVFVAYSLHNLGPFGRWSIFGMVLGMVVSWFYWRLVIYVEHRLPAEPGPVLGSTKMQASEKGVSFTCGAYTSFVAWEGVRHMVASGDFFLLFVDNHLAHFIPLSAIGDGEAVEKFNAQLSELKQSAAAC